MFGREWLKNLSVICVEKNPCNSSQLLVCKGMFVFALWQKCFSSFVCFEENSSEDSLVFVLKRMLVMPLSYLLWKECLWIPLFFVKECLEILSANFLKSVNSILHLLRMLVVSKWLRYLLRHKYFETFTDICLEKNPCTASWIWV